MSVSSLGQGCKITRQRVHHHQTKCTSSPDSVHNMRKKVHHLCTVSSLDFIACNITGQTASSLGSVCVSSIDILCAISLEKVFIIMRQCVSPLDILCAASLYKVCVITRQCVCIINRHIVCNINRQSAHNH